MIIILHTVIITDMKILYLLILELFSQVIHNAIKSFISLFSLTGPSAVSLLNDYRQTFKNQLCLKATWLLLAFLLEYLLSLAFQNFPFKNTEMGAGLPLLSKQL